MASTIKSSRTSEVNTHRFPEWSAAVSYPTGSFVSHTDSDSVIRFWIAIDDVPSGLDNPAENITNNAGDNVYWAEAFSSNTRQLSSSLETLASNLDGLFDLLQFDSEIKRIGTNIDDLLTQADVIERKIDRLDSDFDSDFKTLSSSDSDLNKRIDSEVANRKALEQYFIDYVDDSFSSRDGFDSDITALLDSEIQQRIFRYSLLKSETDDFDSEFTIKKDIDSDILAAVQRGEYYVDVDQFQSIYDTVYSRLKPNWDSDIQYRIDNNYKLYPIIDSEYLSEMEQRYIVYVQDRAALFQTTNIIQTLRYNNGMVELIDGGNAFGSGTITITDMNKYPVVSNAGITVEYSAYHLKDDGNFVVQSGRLWTRSTSNFIAGNTYPLTEIYTDLNGTATNFLTNFNLEVQSNDEGFLTASNSLSSTAGTDINARIILD